jgi:hypothetical protein
MFEIQEWLLVNKFMLVSMYVGMQKLRNIRSFRNTVFLVLELMNIYDN